MCLKMNYGKDACYVMAVKEIFIIYFLHISLEFLFFVKKQIFSLLFIEKTNILDIK